MAIQTINLTVPGGDTPRSANTKINANFSNTSHAASRLVGLNSGNLLEHGAYGIGRPTPVLAIPSKFGFHEGGGSGFVAPEGMASIDNALSYGAMFTGTRTSGSQLMTLAFGLGVISLTETKSSGEFVRYTQAYTTQNTTKDSNGFLKAASPIVKVFADKVELNDDAVNQDVTYKKNGIGDYTITTQSGLSTDGWYIELPKDMNGNPKVAIGTLDDKDGVITLKTYKRIFNTETSNFVPDLNEPLDIPNGRWIDLRLNEIPVEEVNP